MHTYQYYILFLSLSSGLKKCDCYRRWIRHLGVPHLWIPIPQSDMVQGRLPNRKLHWLPDNLPEWNCSAYDSGSLCRRQRAIYLQCCERGWDRQHLLLPGCAGWVAMLPCPCTHAHHSQPTLPCTVGPLHTSQWCPLLEWGQGGVGYGVNLNCYAKQGSRTKWTKCLTLMRNFYLFPVSEEFEKETTTTTEKFTTEEKR